MDLTSLKCFHICGLHHFREPTPRQRTQRGGHRPLGGVLEANLILHIWQPCCNFFFLTWKPSGAVVSTSWTLAAGRSFSWEKHAVCFAGRESLVFPVKASVWGAASFPGAGNRHSSSSGGHIHHAGKPSLKEKCSQVHTVGKSSEGCGFLKSKTTKVEPVRSSWFSSSQQDLNW